MKRRIIWGLILTAIVSTMGFYFYHPRLKISGAYEYVRKADKYIKEDKYDKAIELLYKAYQESNGSEKVKKELIYGYIRYIKFLDKKGKISQAIDCALKACEFDSADKTLRHKLAYLYAKKAVIESKEGRAESASVFIQKSIDAAVFSKKVRKNISIFLFNHAGEAFNKKDDATLILCLDASYELWSRIETLDFLGEYYYRKPELKQALFYWEKAHSIDPDNEDIKKKVEKAKKDMLIRENMKIVKSGSFDVRLHDEFEIDTEKLQEILGGIYKQVGEDLGFFPSLEIPIVLYREQDFRDIFKKTGITRAFYDGNIRMTLPVGVNDPAFKGVLAHEYTHAVISMITEGKCPAWIHEGIAVYEQSRYDPVTTLDFKQYLEEEENVSLKGLDEGFSQEEDYTRILSYEGAYTAVSFILDKWGWNGMRDLLESLKSGKHYVNAMDEVFYMSQPRFEATWMEYCRNHLT